MRDFTNYIQAIPRLEAQELLDSIVPNSYPHLKEAAQKKQLSQLRKIAVPKKKSVNEMQDIQSIAAQINQNKHLVK